MTERENFDTAALDLGHAFGYLYDYEVIALQMLAKTLPLNAKIVNFGAGTGTSGMAFRLGNPTAKVWTIDISEGGPLGGLENERNAFNSAGIPIMLPEQILGCSWDVGNEWQEKIDMVFIDGDHSSEAVEKDIDAWIKHVKPGGYALFHDYEKDVWAGVKKVVDAKMEYHMPLFQIETVKVFRIRK